MYSSQSQGLQDTGQRSIQVFNHHLLGAYTPRRLTYTHSLHCAALTSDMLAQP